MTKMKKGAYIIYNAAPGPKILTHTLRVYTSQKHDKTYNHFGYYLL